MKNLDDENFSLENINGDQIRSIVLRKLQEFGFTKNESKIYEYLSKKGPEKALVISKKTKIPRTEIYHLLRNLRDKGAIEQSISRPIKVSSKPIHLTLESIIHLHKRKIEELNNKKNEIIGLWNLIQGRDKISESSYSKIELATKKYLESQQFRQDFKEKLKKFREEPSEIESSKNKN